MTEYRICETCDHPNEVSNLQCVACGADISFVSPTTLNENKAEPRGDDTSFGDRISEPWDDTSFWDNDRPISGSDSLSRNEESGNRSNSRSPRPTSVMRLKLVSKQDGFELIIPAAGCVLGRDGDVAADYFEAKSTYVSRRHIRIVPLGDSFSVVDEQSSNRTWINQQRLEYNQEYVLKVGDSLVMADLEFVVVMD